MTYNANCTSPNIKDGVNIGGVLGSLQPAPTTMSGFISPNTVLNYEPVVLNITVPAGTQSVFIYNNDITRVHYINKLPWTGVIPIMYGAGTSGAVEIRAATISGTTLSVTLHRVSGSPSQAFFQMFVFY